MNIFVSCGEPSGDVYAGGLIRCLRSRFGCDAWGMLGDIAKDAGGVAVWGYESLHLMGIVEVIPAIPRLLKLRNEIAGEIIRRNPDCVVVIDSPDFHLPLVRKIRENGYKGKIVYLVTPTVWAWRSGRAKTLRECCDLCLPLFSFENEWLVSHGVKSAWKVHPLVERINGYVPPRDIPKGKIVAFMPGSRRYDIKWHLDVLLESAEKVREFGYRPVFSIAPGLYGELRNELTEKVCARNFDLCEAEGRALLSVCDAAVGVSGTISVEALLLRKFMVVVYNGNIITWLVWKTMIRAQYVSIPNMLASGPIFPEFLSSDMKTENIVYDLAEYLQNDERKLKVDSLISEAVARMGAGNAAEFWAERIGDLIN